MSDSGLTSLFGTLFDGLSDIQSTRYARAASNIIILYDYWPPVITFDKEVVLIWQSKWSLAGIILLLNRYYTLAGVSLNYYVYFSPAITDTVSTRYYIWEGWSRVVFFMLVLAILQMRIYALYSMNKKVLAFVLTFYVSLSAVAGWLMWTDLASFTASAVPIPGGKFRIPSPDHLFPRFYALWIPILLFDSLLGGLAFFRGLQEFKSTRSFFGPRLSLIEILIRDSVFYFFAIAVSYLTCLFLWKFAALGLTEAPMGFPLTISSVLASRVLFNLRDAAQDTAPLFRSGDY